MSKDLHEFQETLRLIHKDFAAATIDDDEMYLLSAPIPMVLFCPACGKQHIDAPDDDNEQTVQPPGFWSNPPHRSHLCHGCDYIWRPADVCTTGVAAVETKGQNDSPVVSKIEEIAADARRLAEVVSEVHSWIVCAAIATDADMMQNAPRIVRITDPDYRGD